MANKSEGLFTDYLFNRWAVTSAPAAGTTCVASVGKGAGSTNLSLGKGRHILEGVIYSLKNLTGASVTAVMEVREASIAGTVLASVDIIVAAGVTVQDCFSQWYIPATRGNDLCVSFNTVQASVAQKLNPFGWTEVSQVD